jgi:SAM-dependent methyltransferase
MDLKEKSMKNNDFLKKLVPNVKFDNGFIHNGKILPFYSSYEEKLKGNWTNELTESLEESSRNHFIDIYNRKIVLDAIKSRLNSDSIMIDFGCSSGYMLEDIINKYPLANVIGSDFLDTGLVQCHGRLPQIPLFQSDLTECDFPDNFFDAISCLNVLEHINDDDKAIYHLYRILKKSGIIIITVPVNQKLFDMYDEIHYHVRRYDLNELTEKMRKQGFKILKSNHFGVFIYPLFYITKKINKIRFDKLPFDEKVSKAFKQIRLTEKSGIMETMCKMEYSLGNKIKYPIGIRGYIIATK